MPVWTEISSATAFAMLWAVSASPIYLSHLFYAYCINQYVSVEYSVGIRLAAYFAVSFATAFVVMLGGKAIRCLLPKIKTRAASLLLEQ